MRFDVFVSLSHSALARRASVGPLTSPESERLLGRSPDWIVPASRYPAYCTHRTIGISGCVPLRTWGAPIPTWFIGSPNAEDIADCGIDFRGEFVKERTIDLRTGLHGPM